MARPKSMILENFAKGGDFVVGVVEAVVEVDDVGGDVHDVVGVEVVVGEVVDLLVGDEHHDDLHEGGLEFFGLDVFEEFVQGGLATFHGDDLDGELLDGDTELFKVVVGFGGGVVGVIELWMVGLDKVARGVGGGGRVVGVVVVERVKIFDHVEFFDHVDYDGFRWLYDF